jgi:hypothetical protein
VRADDATIFGAAVIEWDAPAGRSWVQGPWVAGDDDAWTLHAPSLLDAALTQLPADVHRMELSGEVANTRLAALAAQRGWRPSGVHHALIADDATIARWAPAAAITSARGRRPRPRRHRGPPRRRVPGYHTPVRD